MRVYVPDRFFRLKQKCVVIFSCTTPVFMSQVYFPDLDMFRFVLFATRVDTQVEFSRLEHG